MFPKFKAEQCALGEQKRQSRVLRGNSNVKKLCGKKPLTSIQVYDKAMVTDRIKL
jgi:hypothetical protein